MLFRSSKGWLGEGNIVLPPRCVHWLVERQATQHWQHKSQYRGGNIIFNRTPLATCEAVLPQLKKVDKFLNEDYSYESIFSCISPKPATLYKCSVKLYIKFCSLCNFRKPRNDSEPPSACGFGVGACLLCHVYIAILHLKFSHGESEVRCY